MKKIIALLIATVFLFSSEAKAQEMPSEGDMIIHLGAGLGGWGLIGYKTFPLLNVTGEYILMDDIGGLGALGVGAVVGFKKYEYELLDGYSYSRIFIAPRGVVHFDLNMNNVDFYLGAQLAISVWPGVETNEFFTVPAGFSARPGIVGGANIHLTENIGFFGELGYGLGIINAGLMLKL